MSRPHRLLVVETKSDRNPIVVWLLIALILIGLSSVFGVSQSDTIRDLDRWIVCTWGLGLSLSASIKLVGIYVVDPVYSAILRISGLLGLISTLLFYDTALVSVYGRRATFTIILASSLIVACVSRTRQHLGHLREIRSRLTKEM